jgi:N-acetylneuraminate synthase
MNFSKQIKIGDKIIGKGYPTYIIAEIGANFDGDIKKAKLLVRKAKEAGADCAKFQSFISEKIVSRKGFASMNLKGVHGSWNRPVDEVFKDAEFPREWHKEISDYCNEIGIHFSTSPYDFDAVDLCEKLDVPFIKIGSGDITWHEMLEYIAKKNKPMFLATGDATLSEIDEAVRIIESTGNMNLILMQCITNYPSMIESANINVLKTYENAFDILTGYSDHSPGLVVALGSVSLGACVIEKHFTLDNNDIGPDHPHSMNYANFSNMVKAIRELESALGSTVKKVVEEEEETVIVQRRSIYANKFIPKGKVIEYDDLIELRPAIGIEPKYKPIIIGKVSKENIENNTPIKWNQI